MSEATPLYRDHTRPLVERVADLIGRMSLEEKVGQLRHGAAAVPRLGIAAYNWWSEGLHGVARNGRATVFPQVIGMAAAWDPGLIRRVAAAISAQNRVVRSRTRTLSSARGIASAVSRAVKWPPYSQPASYSPGSGLRNSRWKKPTMAATRVLKSNGMTRIVRGPTGMWPPSALARRWRRQRTAAGSCCSTRRRPASPGLVPLHGLRWCR